MKKKRGLEIDAYLDDFGNTWRHISVKKAEEAPLADNFYNEVDPNIVKCSGIPFSPRKLVAKFENGTFVYPVAQRDQIIQMYNQLVDAGAICVDLVGEKWILVNNAAVAGIVSSYGNITKTAGTTGLKTSIVYNYTSDVSDSIILKTAFETEPGDLLALQRSCISEIDNATCATSGLGIKPRKLIAKMKETSGGSIVRNIPITDESPNACASDNASLVDCFSYKGESVRNLKNVVNTN